MNNEFIPVNTPLITKQDAKCVYETVKSGWISSSGKNINISRILYIIIKVNFSLTKPRQLCTQLLV